MYRESNAKWEDLVRFAKKSGKGDGWRRCSGTPDPTSFQRADWGGYRWPGNARQCKELREGVEQAFERASATASPEKKSRGRRKKSRGRKKKPKKKSRGRKKKKKKKKSRGRKK